jgi:FkbM family methyltransferase
MKLHGVDFNSISLNTLLILYEEIFYKNEYYFKSTTKKPIIIDCGSNVGMSILYFKTLFKDSIIHSFEPDFYAFQTLVTNFSNSIDVFLNNNALSNENKELNFYYNNDHKSSLSMSLFKQRESKNCLNVKAIKLSDYIYQNNIEHIDFIKIDIEGAEIEVFKDLKESNLFKRIDKMCIEYHHKFPGEKSNFSFVLSVLEEFGFEYQLYGDLIPKNKENQFQDLILYCYKND